MARGMGLGRGGGRQRDFGASECYCPHCGYSEAHSRGRPCITKRCPECGSLMRGR